MADKLAETDDCEAYKRRNATQLNKRKTDTRRPTKESSANNNNNAKDNVH